MTGTHKPDPKRVGSMPAEPDPRTESRIGSGRDVGSQRPSRQHAATCFSRLPGHNPCDCAAKAEAWL